MKSPTLSPPTDFGKRLKRARTWRKKSVAECAAVAGMTERKWQAIESGGDTGLDDIKPDQAVSIHRLLNLNLDWLLMGEKDTGEIPPASFLKKLKR